MNCFEVAIRDIKVILKNRFVRVAIAAIIIVPLMYSLLYLDAFWDPYSKLEDMPVAVVNLDEGYEIDGESVNYGEDFVEKLKENNSVGWRFVSEYEANEGLEGNKYYAKLELPKDFSKDVASAKEKTPTKAQLNFVCNEKKNFLAAQVNSKVESELKTKITKTITETYSSAAFQNLYEVKDGMEQAADGSKKLYDGLSQVNTKVPELTSGASKLSDGSTQLYDGQVALNAGLLAINNGLGTLSNGTSQLESGSLSVNQGLYSLKDGLGSLNGGFSELNSKVPTLTNGVNSLYVGSSKLLQGTTSAKDGSTKLMNGASTLYDSYASTIYPSIHQLNEGSKQIETGLSNGQEGINQLAQAAPKLEASSTQLATASQSISDNYDAVAAGVEQLISASSSTSDVMQAVGEDLKNAMGSTDEQTKNASIMAALQKLQTYQQQNQGAKEKVQTLQAGVTSLQKGTHTYNEGMKNYTQGVKTFSSGTTNLINSFGTLKTGISQISGGLDKLDTGLSTQFGPGLKAVSDGTTVVNAGLTQLEGGASSINTGLSTVNSSVPALANGVTALSEGSNKALNGASALYDGSGKLYNGIVTASSGASKLYTGSNDAVQGSNKLVSGQNELKNGVGTLVSAVPALQDGVTKLYNGSDELSTKLSDGAGELDNGLINSPEDMAEFMSTPVELNVSPINPVPNYGTGFAPYFMNLSLWIGAIMMFFVISPNTVDDKNTSKFAKVIGKFIVFSIVGLMQAVLVGVVVMALGLRPVNTPLYFALLLFFSLVFVAMVQCLISLFGDAGRLASIVLLILQLTACGGTFPLEIIPKVFRVLNPFMPFTYSVEALREVSSATTTNYGMIGKDVLILLVFGVVSLIIAVLLKNAGERLIEKMESKKSME